MTEENKTSPADDAAEGTNTDADAAANAAEAAAETGDMTPEQRIAELEAEVTALKDRVVRTYADLENTRKRAERDRQDALNFGATKFARDICEVADNLGRAISAVPEDAADENVVALLEGVKITQASLRQIFERHGVKEVEAEGQKFDPNLHEAMTEIDVPGAPPGTCLQVIEAGYTLNGRLLRPARVIVSKASPDGAAASGATIDTSA